MKFSILLFTVFALCECEEVQYRLNAHIGSLIAGPERFQENDLNPNDIIENLGYSPEMHYTDTPDGYRLCLHRIPYSRYSPTNSSTRPYPVLLQHGLLGSSLDFFLLSTRDALPFLLSDLGFDVWLGNIRGNLYSRKNKKLTPKDRDYWNFTWQEAGLTDLPVMIDYVLKATQAPKLIYVGYSMGSTIYFVLTSSMPEYNQKIKVSLLMAPMAFGSNIRSPIMRFLTPFSKKLSTFRMIASGEFLKSHTLLEMATKHFCAIRIIEDVLCRKHLYIVYGADYKHFNPNATALFLNKYPAGFSAKGINHYAQLRRSGKFQKYDYGPLGNYQNYGTTYAPDFDLSRIDVPTYFYVGENDYLSNPQDANYTATQMRSVKKMLVVEDPKFNHLDYLAGLDVRNLVYKPLLADMLTELQMNV